jgi:hypothetical protein
MPPTTISLISNKQCNKVISQTGNFIFIVIHDHSNKKVVATSMASKKILSLQQKQVDGILEEYKDIFSSPTRVPMHYQVKHPINLTPSEPLPNGPFYHISLMENDEIKCHIQELLQKGHIIPKSSPYRIPIVPVKNKDGTW